MRFSNLSVELFRLLPLGVAGFLGCNENANLMDLQGRFSGSQVSSSGATLPVIAQIPLAKSEDGILRLQFKVYAVLGSAQGVEYQVELRRGSELSLARAPEISAPVQLQFSTDGTQCAEGSLNPGRVRLCWSANQLKYEIQGTPRSDTTLQLSRGSTLPATGPSDPERLANASRTYTLDELVGRARFMSYEVREEAEKLIQAQENIRVARGNLLPSINLKSVVAVATGDFLEPISRLVPFIFPSNWYRWDTSRALYEAQKASFAALRGNQMLEIEQLAFQYLRDQAVIQHSESLLRWSDAVSSQLLALEKAGHLPHGTAMEFGLNTVIYERDQVALTGLLRTELQELSQAVGLSLDESIGGIEAFSAHQGRTNLDAVSPLPDSDEIAREAREKSLELRTLKALLRASEAEISEMQFLFLDYEGPGLGFFTPAQIEFSKAKKRSIEVDIAEMESQINRRAVEITTDYNTALKVYSVVKRARAEASQRLESLVHQMMIGDDTWESGGFMDRLINLRLRAFRYDVEISTAQQTWQWANASLHRFLRKGFYSDLEAATPERLQ